MSPSKHTMKELEVDESDDVSALSMDGASAIAGMSFAKRMRKDFAKLELVGEEEDEAENDEQHGDPPRSRISSNLERTINNGNELIEPFPKTYEEWQRKKERKERKKEKKKHKKKKKSSKSGSRASRSSKSQKEDIHPIMEISIQSVPDNDNEGGSSIRPDQRRSSQESKDASNLSSGYPSITSSTADSTRRGSSSFIDSGGIRRHSSNLQHSYRSGLSHGNNSQSESANSRTHMTGHSTHMTGHSTTSQSHITADTLHQLRTSLDRVKIEEQQVMDIHSRLETEVQNAQVKAENTKLQLQSITSELQSSSLEREALHKRLDKLQHENKKLKAKLHKLEEVESDGALDDVLDSMQAKIRQLKNRGNKQRSSRAKEKERTMPRSERIDEGE